jgi:Fe-S-cluster containining protein
VPKAIRMTLDEVGALMDALPDHETRQDKLLTRLTRVDGQFFELKAAPCPLLVDNQCSVYAVRPFVCRRFQCHRAAGEAFDPSGPLGCKNLSDRLEQSRVTRRAYALNQRKAARWGLAHGWKGDEA